MECNREETVRGGQAGMGGAARKTPGQDGDKQPVAAPGHLHSAVPAVPCWLAKCMDIRAARGPPEGRRGRRVAASS